MTRRVLVIVPFAMSDDNLRLREQQLAGLQFGADLRFEHPADGRYFEFHGSMLDEYSQYYRALYGKAGKYRVQAFVRTQPNVTSGNARSIWDGVGSQHLTLKPPLTPSAS